MAYEVVMPYHLHMPSYFLETFTEYPTFNANQSQTAPTIGNQYTELEANINYYFSILALICLSNKNAPSIL